MATLGFVGIWFWANVLFVFAHPLFFLQLFFPAIWALTMAALAGTSPYRRAVKWWLFMPLTSLAGAIAGTFIAGLLLWVPTIVLADFHLPREESLEWPVVQYLAFGGGVSALLAFRYARRIDRRLHA